ncbi:hypothetical protein [Nocardioides plantarum]|uniref:hypothetical protein n=1 Tax=Nocardioides plantarum TaxID=29299 RepID=UPI003611A57D
MAQTPPGWAESPGQRQPTQPDPDGDADIELDDIGRGGLEARRWGASHLDRRVCGGLEARRWGASHLDRRVCGGLEALPALSAVAAPRH